MALNLNIEYIMKLPLSRRLLILAGINVFIIVIFYWFLINPKSNEIDELRKGLDDLSRKLAESRRIAKDIPRFQAEKEELEKKLKEALTQLPNEKEIPSLIESISNVGRTAGLKILLFKPGNEVPKDFYAEVPIRMIVQGSFKSLYNFWYRVSKLPRIVNISGISITTVETKERSPVLKAEFLATTFRFITSPAKGEAKKQ